MQNTEAYRGALQDLMARNGWSPADLARHAQVEQATLSRILNCKVQRISNSVAMRLAAVNHSSVPSSCELVAVPSDAWERANRVEFVGRVVQTFSDGDGVHSVVVPELPTKQYEEIVYRVKHGEMATGYFWNVNVVIPKSSCKKETIERLRHILDAARDAAQEAVKE